MNLLSEAIVYSFPWVINALYHPHGATWSSAINKIDRKIQKKKPRRQLPACGYWLRTIWGTHSNSKIPRLSCRTRSGIQRPVEPGRITIPRSRPLSSWMNLFSEAIVYSFPWVINTLPHSHGAAWSSAIKMIGRKLQRNSALRKSIGGYPSIVKEFCFYVR